MASRPKSDNDKKKHDVMQGGRTKHSLLLHEDDMVDYDDSDDDEDKEQQQQQDVSSVAVEHDKEKQQQLPSFVEEEGEASISITNRSDNKITTASTATIVAPEENKRLYYVPPAVRARRLQQQQQRGDDDHAMQFKSWNELKATIQGTVNRWNTANVRECVLFLFEHANLIRGRGLLARSILTQAAAATAVDDKLTQVAAAVVAVINSKLPEVGELILTRALSDLKKQLRRRNNGCTVFLGHLINQSVAHEIVALQMLALLLQYDNNNANIETAIDLVKVCANKLQETSPNGLRAVIERFRHILHQGLVSDKLQYAIEDLLVSSSSNKSKFYTKHPLPELDLVEEEDQITHELGLDDTDNNTSSSEDLVVGRQDTLDIFRFDEQYEENAQLWAKIRAEILGQGDDDDDTNDEQSNDNTVDDDEEEETAIVALDPYKANQTQVLIQDLTEQDLIHLRRTIYLTIMSSASFEECAHKLASLNIPNGRENELVNMLIECCSQERTFIRYYGLIGQRFCLLRESRWAAAFTKAFAEQFTTIHRLETNKLRNVAKLFAHLFHTDAIPWNALEIIRMNEEETTSSSRIFIKILIQEMAEAMGMDLLKQRFFATNDAAAFKGMFPKDNPRSTRYAINFFTSIGLGPLTEGLREHLKNAPMLLLAQARAAAAAAAAEEESSSSSSSSSETASSSSFDRRRRRRSYSRKDVGKKSRRRSYSSSSSSSYTSSSSSSDSYTSRSSGSSSRSSSRSPSPPPKKRSEKIISYRSSRRTSSRDPSSSSDDDSRYKSKSRSSNRKKRNESSSLTNVSKSFTSRRKIKEETSDDKKERIHSKKDKLSKIGNTKEPEIEQDVEDKRSYHDDMSKRDTRSYHDDDMSKSRNSYRNKNRRTSSSSSSSDADSRYKCKSRTSNRKKSNDSSAVTNVSKSSTSRRKIREGTSDDNKEIWSKKDKLSKNGNNKEPEIEQDVEDKRSYHDDNISKSRNSYLRKKRRTSSSSSSSRSSSSSFSSNKAARTNEATNFSKYENLSTDDREPCDDDEKESDSLRHELKRSDSSKRLSNERSNSSSISVSKSSSSSSLGQSAQPENPHDEKEGSSVKNDGLDAKAAVDVDSKEPEQSLIDVDASATEMKKRNRNDSNSESPATNASSSGSSSSQERAQEEKKRRTK